MLRKNLLAGLLAVAMLTPSAFAGDAEKPALDPATRKAALKAIEDGNQFLKSRQDADGSWAPKTYPAITAMATRAILGDPSHPADSNDPIIKKGLAYVVSCAQPDGGIYCQVPREKGGTQANYNTAHCLLMLHALHETGLEPLILAARGCLIRTQHLDKDDYCGGWGYDAGRKDPHADISNTGVAMEALSVTARPPKPPETALTPAATAKPSEPAQAGNPSKTETPPAAASDDPNWAAAAAFLSHCQNLAPATEKARAVSKGPKDYGGFYYHPNGSMAGGEKDAEGQQVWHSYGNATALGLECLLEAGVNRKDPRVAATVNWFRENYNLEEHAGLGQAGLYFYYHTLADALSMYGEEPLKRGDKPAADWRGDLVKKLIALQRTDPATGLKFWKNDDGKWMENDPVLVTSLSVLALETLLKEPAVKK